MGMSAYAIFTLLFEMFWLAMGWSGVGAGRRQE